MNKVHLGMPRTAPSPQAMVDNHFESEFRYWDRIYGAKDVASVIYQSRQETVLEMIDALRLPEGARVLEIGCGAGHLAVRLAQRGLLVDAIDGADSMIATARNRALRAGVGNRLTVGTGDVNKLDADSGTYDLVVAVGVLPWLTSLGAPLREMARVIKPGGSLLVTVDNRWALHRFLEPRVNPLVMPLKRRILQLLVRLSWIPAKAQARTWSVKETDLALARAGLSKRTGITIGFGPFTVWRWNLVSEQRGIQLNGWLQRLAGGGKGIGNAGAHYIVLASCEKLARAANGLSPGQTTRSPAKRGATAFCSQDRRSGRGS